MGQYIKKSALVAKIERLIDEIYAGRPFDSLSSEQQTALWYIKSIMSSINTIEVKEVDLNEYYHEFLQKEWFGNSHVRTVSEMMAFTAKHFFELGLKTQHSSINIPNIDDIFEENGIDPNSKDAKIFKESYYMALEKLKAQKGE